MAPKPFTENRYQRFLRKVVSPMMYNHLALCLMGLAGLYVVIILIYEHLSSNSQLFGFMVLFWLFVALSCAYSRRCKKRYDKHQFALRTARSNRRAREAFAPLFTSSSPFAQGHDVIRGEVIARRDHR